MKAFTPCEVCKPDIKPLCTEECQMVCPLTKEYRYCGYIICLYNHGHCSNYVFRNIEDCNFYIGKD